jgi:hypothetical protein
MENNPYGRYLQQQCNHIVILNEYVHRVTLLIIFMSNLSHTRYKLMHSPFKNMHSPPQKSPRNSPYILTQDDEYLHKPPIKSTKIPCQLCMRWCSWFRQCTTSQKVTGSIPAGVNIISHWLDHFECTVALGQTWLLTEMSTRDVSWWVRQLMCVTDNLTTIMCQLARNFGSLNLLQPIGPVQACTGIALLFPC